MLFPITIFLSAFLLFQVQPMMGRYVLPWFGGTPAVWSVCLLFFQCVLLAGYGYAHWLGSLKSTRTQAAIHITLLAASIALLPIAPNPEIWKPQDASDPQEGFCCCCWRRWADLIFCCRRRLRCCSDGDRGRIRGAGWRLYALSNFGSFLALFSYPFLVEPFVRLKVQSWEWSALYAGFVGVCGFTALRSRRQKTRIGRWKKVSG
ncbi:MAG: hypothetical protein WDO18_23250 [Acidobacteriota bacterium]